MDQKNTQTEKHDERREKGVIKRSRLCLVHRAVMLRSHPEPKARGSSWEEPPTPKARARSREEQPEEPWLRRRRRA